MRLKTPVGNFYNKKSFSTEASAGAGVGFLVKNPSICVASEQRETTTIRPLLQFVVFTN
ncbi:MAG: hypothetical protein ACYCTD_04710 [bacterium]